MSLKESDLKFRGKIRQEDSPDLFGRGIGLGTCAEITCDWCGRMYNEGQNDHEMSYFEKPVLWTSFGGKTVCECCFVDVETEVLKRIGDILPWYERFLQALNKDLVDAALQLKNVKEAKDG